MVDVQQVTLQIQVKLNSYQMIWSTYEIGLLYQKVSIKF